MQQCVHQWDEKRVGGEEEGVGGEGNGMRKEWDEKGVDEKGVG